MAINLVRDLKNLHKTAIGFTKGTVQTVLADPVTAARAAMGDPTAQVAVVRGAIANNPALKDDRKELANAALTAAVTLAPVVTGLMAKRDLEAAWTSYTQFRTAAARSAGFSGAAGGQHQRAYSSAYTSLGAKAPSSETVAAAWNARAAGVSYAVPGLESLSGAGEAPPREAPPATPPAPPVPSPGEEPRQLDTGTSPGTLLLIAAAAYFATQAA